MARFVDRSDQANARRFYQSGAWQKLRDAHLAKHPNCVFCGRPGRKVDHKKPRRLRPDLALDPRNLQTLCDGDHESVKKHHEHDDRHPLGGGVDASGRPLAGSHPWNRAGNGSLERVEAPGRADVPDNRLSRLAGRIRPGRGIQ
jgi:5-methylcytosine-specific restriction endonuclease McrA